MSERAAYWWRLLGEWERSGLSQAEFCRRRGVTVGTFSWWKHRLRGPTRAATRVHPARMAPDQSGDRGSGHRRGVAEQPGRAAFVEVILPGGRSCDGGASAAARSVPGGGYELVLPGGGELRLPPDFEPERIARLLQALAPAAGAAPAPAGAGGASC